MAEPSDPVIIQTRHLLGREVVGPDDRLVGHVVDLKAVQDGPLRDGSTASLRIDGLVVGHHGLAERLGLARHAIKGPWLLKQLAKLGKPCAYLDWAQLDDPRGLVDPDHPIRCSGELRPMGE